MEREQTRTQHLGSNEEFSVHGWAHGEARDIIIVSQHGQYVVVLSSAVLSDLRAAIELEVPEPLREAALQWIQHAV